MDGRIKSSERMPDHHGCDNGIEHVWVGTGWVTQHCAWCQKDEFQKKLLREEKADQHSEATK